MTKLVVGVLAISGMSSVIAANVGMPFSAGLLVGKASQKPVYTSSGAPADSDIAVGVRLGYALSDTWTFEVAYHDNGEAKGSFIDSYGDKITDTTNSSSINVGLKKEFLLNEKFSIDGRIGMSFWDWELQELDSSDPDSAAKWTDSGNDIYLGAALSYRIDSALSVSVDYSFSTMGAGVKNVSTGKNISVDNELSTTSIAVNYQF
jgi:OOP family OmpA-OmpF porin